MSFFQNRCALGRGGVHKLSVAGDILQQVFDLRREGPELAPDWGMTKDEPKHHGASKFNGWASGSACDIAKQGLA